MPVLTNPELAAERWLPADNLGRQESLGFLNSLGKLGDIAAAAIAAIRRNNGSAWWVPDDLTNANIFTDSTGTTPVTAVGDVVGKLNDRVGSNHATQATTASKPVIARVPKRLGPELVSNGDGSSTTGWTAVNGTVTATAGELVVTYTSGGYSQAYFSIPTTIGKTYTVSALVRRGTATSNAGLTAQDSTGTSTAVGVDTAATTLTPLQTSFVATTSTSRVVVFHNTATPSGTIMADNISVREVLEWSNVLDFDGSNDKLISTIPQPTTAFTFICAANFTGTVNQVLTNSGLNGVGIYRGGGIMSADKSGVGSGLIGTFPDGMAVLSVVLGPGSRKMYRNGVLIASDTTTVTFSSTGPMNFGASDTGGSPFNGEIYGVVAGNFAITDADRRTIERYMAQQIGATLS